DYFDYGFRKNAKLTKAQVDALVDHEVMVKAYQRCIRKLTNKDRSRKEIQDMLEKETECSESDIQGIIEKLEQLGYVDDYSLTQEIITTQKASLMGKNRILKALKSRGISDEMATTLLENRSGDEADNAKAYAEKIRRTIHDKSLVMKKKAMYQQLISKGYSSEVANEVIASFDFSEETDGEMENCKKCALKAKKRYENKFEGSKLKSAIFKYCMSNGFNIEDIYTVLDEMEWN
ncbi:MAG: RecX family transcriptional regulator, partial [Erysipelotrichaceae bacterium]|nr:RecX family transcriptional regulator [Erysipelotrichaceae bacterium]